MCEQRLSAVFFHTMAEFSKSKVYWWEITGNKKV